MNTSIKKIGCVRRFIPIFSVVTAIWLFVLTGAALATDQSKFDITSFSMNMVRETNVEEIGEAQNGSPELEFKNVPYVPAFTQAGGHPWGLDTKFSFTKEEQNVKNGVQNLHETVPTQDPKDIVDALPPGLLGNPLAVPRCSLALITLGTNCPPETQVGVYDVHEYDGKQLLGPIVDVSPEVGESAEFALESGERLVNPLLTAHLIRTPQGYGLTVAGDNTPNIGIYEAELVFWGVPADQSHTLMRNRFCASISPGEPMTCNGGGAESAVLPVPFLTLPMNCVAGPETTTLRVDTWEEPGEVLEGQYRGFVERNAQLPGVTDCNRLEFEPSLSVQPDTMMADEPVGIGVSLQFPQHEASDTLATPELRGSTITLPEGMSVSPSIVDGVQACEASGMSGINFTGHESEETGPSGELQLAPGKCPQASTIGTVTAVTPLLGQPLAGHVYLAKPGCGGAGQAACTLQDAVDGNLYRLYLELGGTGEFANSGVNLKFLGRVQANPATGQLTSVFVTTPGQPETELPELPVDELHVSLNGGPRAALDNPPTCGPAVTTSDFSPWSSPGFTPEGLATAGTPDATPSSYFQVTGCASPTPLNPGFSAGTVTTRAGGFTSFTMNLTRQDREQYIKGVQIKTPPGLLGMLSNVPLCGEPQADAGTCSEASKIGTTRVASGAGSHPFEIEGNVYLTGPHDGAPFGLSIVTNVVAGPFNLGLVVVRARIDVNRETSALTVTTDETGPYAVPQIIFGVPLRLKRITVNVTRPSFIFNPTNCAAFQIIGTISGSQDAKASVSSPFAAGGCKSLAFKPKFTASTNGHTSRAKGASLDVKLSYPAGSVGNEANISKVKVDLPRLLPSRLSTLQKACLAATFEANPASCPPGSIVGIVRASTPLLPVGLSGPAYFVSHGGEQFPSLIIVLQGDGVRVDLTGDTFISKGITSSSFKTVPDVPVNSFELYLPQGKDSALAANGNFCSEQSKLVMPTIFIAQNGAQLKQNTKIVVSGCTKTKAKPKKKKKKAKRADVRSESNVNAASRGRER